MEKLLIQLTDLSGGLAYWAIFGILIACGLGFPLPEDIPLIATGLLISYESMTWTGALLVTLSGVLIGDTILFFLGKKLGMKILKKERVQKIFKPEKVSRVRAYFRKYGDKLVFFARFVAGFRSVAFFMAGAMKMKYQRFILLDSLAALLSVPLWIALGYGFGYFFGDEFSKILKSLNNIKMGLSIIIGIIVAVILVKIYFNHQKTKKLALSKRK